MPLASKQIGGIERTLVFPGWPHFDEADIDAVTAVLRSGCVNRWTGQENELFEKEFARFAGCHYAIAVANGTLALELALAALGVGRDDEVIVSCRTFIASASAIVSVGAVPVLADVDPESQNITVETIEPRITKRTKAIIAVHLAGWPCEMDALQELARAYKLKIIEDCAQAHGATYKDRPVGSFGHVAAFSFCQDKVMTTGGEGGMLTTNDTELWRRLWSLKDHGKNYDAVRQKTDGYGFRWLHDTFGTNGRMTEMQAAIGRAALRKLPGWLTKRRQYANMLTCHFRTLGGLRVTVPPDNIDHAYYKYYVFVQPERLRSGRNRDWIMNAINASGVPCFSGSCSEVYLEKAFADAGLQPRDRMPTAKMLGETSLMFQVHPTLRPEHLEKTCNVVREVMGRAMN